MGIRHRWPPTMRPVPAHPPAVNPPAESGDGEAAGAAGAPLALDLSLEDLERDARHVIGEMAYAYYAGGADDERLLEQNVTAWAHWQLHPKVLAGISAVDLSTTLLGAPVSSPVAIAPTAIQGLAHVDGEVATAKGAAAQGALMILSSLATCSLEEVAAGAPGGTRWMQVYILRDRARTVELVQRAEANGYGALVLTVDAPVPGLRLRELRGGVHLPHDLALPNLVGHEHRERPRGRVHGGVPRIRPGPDTRRHRVAGRPQLTPRSGKGVQRADDAVRCVDAGAAAVVVSNHGARQLADAPPTADILGGVVDAVAGRAEVYVDGVCAGPLTSSRHSHWAPGPS